MSRVVVRKIRDDDPEHVQNLTRYGLRWLVIRSPEERLGRAFASFSNAVFWAHRYPHPWWMNL